MTHDSHTRNDRGRCPVALLLLMATLSTLAIASAAGAAATKRTPGDIASPADSARSVAVDPPRVAAERLTREGNGQDGTMCMACHGAHGEGNAAGGVPRLAGLPADYLEKQLLDFTTSSRQSEVMTVIAKSLTPTQRREVARLYASLPPPTARGRSSGPSERRQAMRGQTLVGEGDNILQVQACSNCHGPGGTGLAGTAMPYLAGQQGRYLRNALAAWREGKRNNDPSLQMPTIARRLRAADIDALVIYLGQPEQ